MDCIHVYRVAIQGQAPTPPSQVAIPRQHQVATLSSPQPAMALPLPQAATPHSHSTVLLQAASTPPPSQPLPTALPPKLVSTEHPSHLQAVTEHLPHLNNSMEPLLGVMGPLPLARAMGRLLSLLLAAMVKGQATL
jgi:hypothetical protein